MKILYFALLIISLFITHSISAQRKDINSILDKTLSYRGLTRQDVTIPFDTSDRINTNSSKLILPIVYQLMKDPLSSMPFLDTVTNYKNQDLPKLVNTMFNNINYFCVPDEQKYDFSTDLDKLTQLIADKIRNSHENEVRLLKSFSQEDIAYLQKNLFSLFINSDQNAPENFDIYKLDAAEDSSNAISKRVLDILSKVDRNLIYQNSVSDFNFCYQLYGFVAEHRSELHSNSIVDAKLSGVAGDVLFFYNKDGIKIVIGSTGKNSYTGTFDMIVDLGGDDTYYIDRDTLFSNNFNCIIDLAGNDFYTTGSKFALGASVFSSGFVFDKEGDDVYKGESVNLGASICGIGLIYDESGSDIYSSNSFSIGAGCFGVGMLVDRSGNDFYIANTYSQGFGMTEGIGIIVDNKGNDTYTINPQVLDIGRTNDHFLSMCQGFGFGLRPYYAGGIGIIVDGEGNDSYTADIFGQGCSYWYSLGIVVDSSGNDRYNCYHYAHGSGIHYSVGLMKDYEGWDYYNTNWVSQGCGHDYGFGFLWDVKGNDNYSCYGLSQGAGNANGIGLLIDESGRDGYLCKDNNCQGFGTPSREYGGLGILLDASGTDFYSKPGFDSTVLNASKWGVLNDYYYDDLHPEVAEEQFKLDIDETKSYTRDELYMFARTLEPRFSKWAAYGFNKLAEDSVNTAQFLFSMLGSDDIRDVVVIRNFNTRIGYSFSTLAIDKLKQYMNHTLALSTDEVAFAIFIIGDSKNLVGKDVLLSLTYDPQVRIRSAAVNALGKMNFTDKDSDFKDKVSARLIELAAQNNTRKTYNKDISFAFRNFRNEKNIPTLMKLLGNNYFGVRFNAAEDLTDYGDKYYEYLSGGIISMITTDKLWFYAFLNSIGNFSESKFKDIIEKVLRKPTAKDEAISYHIIETINAKKLKSTDNDFVKWANGVMKDVGKNLDMRLK